VAAPAGKKDLYETLGVARQADADTIKKAYRKQAQRYHPDRNADDAQAEEKFKEVSSAYAVLSDPKRRRDYDEFGDIATDPNFDADKARQQFSGGFGPGMGGATFSQGGGFQDMGDFGNIFENLFTGGSGRGPRPPRPRRGGDLDVELELDFMDAVLGSEQRITLNRQSAEGGAQRETLTIKIPKGVDDAARIRLAGKGGAGLEGGRHGDLYANVRVRPHPFFQRDGRNLSLEVPISISEAVSGASIEIPTLTGSVNLRIPPGTDGGSRLRLRGKGVSAPATGGAAKGGPPKNETAGDLYVTVRIRVPKDLSDESKKTLEDLSNEDPAEWRRHLLGSKTD